MPEIAPGRFVRYAGVSDLTPLVCPPYDVIDDAGRAELEAKSPDNFVRLILPRDQPGDEPLDRYVRARALLDQWLASGVMARDAEPSLFLLEQVFVDPITGDQRVRRGIQALVKLREFSEGIILPHERTLSGPKADRLELMKAVRAHLSPIFILYPDEQNEVLAPLAGLTRARTHGDSPTVWADAAGATHYAWRITDPEVIAGLTERLASRKGYIADGHHRYETALQFRKLARSEGRAVEGTSLDYIPAFLCGMSDPGLVIFPTHRLVHGLDVDVEDLLRRASPFFTSRTVDANIETDDGRKHALAMLDEAARTTNAMLLVDRAGLPRLLTLVGNPPLDAIKGFPPASSPLRQLDVTVLHSIVFEHLLGMSRESQEKQINLRYEKDGKRAITRVRSGEVGLSFLLPPTRMREVRAVAEAGEVMPQKSTYFYPKIIDGLGLQLLD